MVPLMQRPSASASLSLLLGAALVLGPIAGCASAANQPSTHTRAPRPLKKPPAPSAQPAGQGSGFLPASVVASLSGENALALFARRGKEGLLLTSAQGKWQARPLGPGGAPKGPDAIDVAPVPEGVQLATLRAEGDGYLAAWVENVDKNSAVKVLSLDASGKAKGAPALVVQSVDEISWIDILPNAKGAILLWETPRESRSDVTIVPFVGGKAASAPIVAARDALNWQAVGTEQGAVIAAVLASKGAAERDEASGGSRTGSVALFEVSSTGAVSPQVTVSADPTAHADIDIAEVDGSYILAWTDTREIDASVMLAAVAKGGKITKAPHKATAPFGEQALVSLTAAAYGPGVERGKKALLAWEDLLNVPRAGRRIHLATVGPDSATLSDRGSLIFHESGPPDIVADGEGFAAVTLARATPAGESPAPDAPIWPIYVRFGPDLSVLASEPVRADVFGATDGVPYFVRSLSCQGGECATLAGGSGAPAPLALLSLPLRESKWRAPARREVESKPPRASSVTALYEGEHLSRVTAANQASGGSLVAWLTYVLEGPAEEGPRGKAANAPQVGATLGVRPISAEGAPGKVTLLSRDALSFGGVALAPAPAPSAGKAAETAIAWVARERGEAQVFVTKVGDDGQKLAQQKVTTASRKKKAGVPNECSDVAIAYDPGDVDGAKPGAPASSREGFILAWVDTRDGNAEVYVTKLDRQLKKLIPEKRVTQAPGDSAEVQLAIRGKEIFLVWSDARKSPDEGNGDIYLARLDRSLQKAGEEAPLFASAGHSRSPSLVSTPSGLNVVWIEEAAGENKAGAEAEGGGLRLARLDDRGAVIGAPALLRGEDGTPVTSVSLSCGPKGCRGALSSAIGDALSLGAFELSIGGVVGPIKSLASLSGGAGQDVSLAFAGPGGSPLFFADNAVGGTGRVRMMTIDWP